MTHKTYLRRSGHRSGLILLIVLGMLAMFTLLAVSYVVTAGASRAGTKSLEVRARNSGLTIAGSANEVVSQAIRGTSNQKSPFYQMSLLGDVFGPKPIITQFGPFNSASINSARRFFVAKTGVNLAKISLLSGAQLNGPLSDFENEYNSRILTILEGPLAGQSFRILKYVGYVGNGDPNIAPTQWSNPSYTDPLAADTRYSVLIDLNEIVGRDFTGEYYDSANATLKTASFTVEEWISNFGIQSLFFLQTAPANWVGYKLLINDAAFNNAGIGMEDVASLPDPMGGPTRIPVRGFGNIDSKRLLRTTREISPTLLTHYDYLQDSALMATNVYDGSVGVDGIGTTRTSATQSVLTGASNEGFDVPDYRDSWLANQSYVGGIPIIKPSYHCPEVVNYISNLFGSPSNMEKEDVAELLRLIDASTARILSYNFSASPINIQKNAGFRENDPTVVRLPSTFTWSTPPTNVQISALQAFVMDQINPTSGGWDVDNDGDGVADSVWMDPTLAVVYSPDGRRLRPLASVLIEDLDGRVNLNTSGDRIQVGNAFNVSTDANYKRQNQIIPQGFGYGPAEISLTSLFKSSNLLLQSSTSQFSFFDELSGARRYARRPINYSDTYLDRVPGKRRLASDLSSTSLQEREIHNAHRHGSLPGLPLARRGGIGMSFDANGNPVLVNPIVPDGDPYNPFTNSVGHETYNDRYESAAMELPTADDPLGLRDLEAILRRYDEDTASQSSRLRNKLGLTSTTYNAQDPINREITVRSAELRYPNLASGLKSPMSTGSDIAASAPGYLRYIQMLHSQRFRQRSFPSAVTDDPEISYAALSELFPMDFAKGLRMDLNRPFGDGYDTNGDGQVDEPREISANAEVETYPVGNVAFTSTGSYVRDIKPIRKLNAQVGDSSPNQPLPNPTRDRLGSRQILARNLYCLAQLIIPRDHLFPGMTSPGISGSGFSLEQVRIRATAIAQWAVNVVDFRDADAAMTRFEFDLLPFGIGSNSGLTAREAFWAPDRMQYGNNKQYIGVVWGMEMPELLLTETLALHDKRLRDTDMDTSTSKRIYDASSPDDEDDDLDQYRFMQSSLFLELYNPRTTSGANNDLIPGAPSSLYGLNGSQVSLHLGRLAPYSSTWGIQPVWRIAISEMYPNGSAQHPETMLRTVTPNSPSALSGMTHQWSTEAAVGMSAPAAVDNTALTGATSIDRNGSIQNGEQYIGSGLYPNLSDHTAIQPVVSTSNGFDRFVWFTNYAPGDVVDAALSTSMGTRIPDASLAVRPYAKASVYVNSGGASFLDGGSYLVVGPRNQTNVGALNHNQFTNFSYPDTLLRNDMTTATNRPILSPSFQRIDLNNNGVETRLLGDQLANSPWSGPTGRIKQAAWMTCSVPAPDDTTVAAANDWGIPFPYGIGLNISLPTPIAGQTIWQKANIPIKRLNKDDIVGSRTDGTPGYGTPTIPPDSWVDLTANPVIDNFPDTPIDKSNPLIGAAGAGRYKSGTYENVRAAYLQRLADPEFPYDPVTNPYITVDWMSIDLTVFNGESRQDTFDKEDLGDAPSAMPPSARTNAFKFQTRYKNGSLSPLATAHGVTADKGISYYSPMTGALRPTMKHQTSLLPANRQSYFMHQLGYTLDAYAGANIGNSASSLGYANVGYYNDGMTLPSPAQMGTATVYGTATSTFFDGFGPPNITSSTAFKGAPSRIAAATWFNRPFASPYELMMVPLTGPGQFGLYHSAYNTVQKREQFGYIPSYQTTNAWNVSLPASITSPGYWAVPSPTPAVRQADWPLLLELVETQPPFVDANKFYRPDTMLAQASTDQISGRFLNSFIPQGYTIQDPSSATATAMSESFTVRGPTLLAPFNMRPSYVAAGKINLNTMSFDSAGQSRALKALEHNYLASERNVETSSLAAAFQNSRQGYVGPVPPNLFFGSVAHPAMHPDYPTRFVGAFRPALSSNLAPQVANPTATERMRGRYGVESMLLRAAADGVNNVTQDTLQAPAGPLADRAKLFQATTVADEQESLQPFVRMQRAMRLPNLATNQSNIFAVWVTVSLFEYDPITGFGNEYVGETGLPERERKFFIVDRTVPVGFKQGETLNTDRTILLQRTLP